MTAQITDFAATGLSHPGTLSPLSGSAAPTVLICDNAVLRSRLQHLLAGTRFAVADGGHAPGTPTCGPAAPEPALVIVAANRPERLRLAIIRQVKEHSPEARVVVMADHFDLTSIWQAREAGVDGFCLTSSPREVLITSLELVMLGESIVPSSVFRSMLNGKSANPEPQATRPILSPSDPRTHRLSAREREILACLMEGAPNKVIARKLNIAEATIKVHVKAVLRKIGLKNRTQAAMWATGHLPKQARVSQHV